MWLLHHKTKERQIMNPSRNTAMNLICGALLSIFGITAFAADCKVNDPDINVEYVGDCLNGLAHGRGNAKGIDTYEGEFKQGNKHGIGTYIWPDGPRYQGNYADDRRNGFGTMTIPRKVYSPQKTSGKGAWIGDDYIETGIFLRSNFVFACGSPETCKQEQSNR
jgi:hypothetical protein